MSEQPSPHQNHLLASIPEEIFERLSPHLELIPMPLGEVLYESGGKLHHVYFPTTAIVSLHYVMENGASAEIAGVGNEGVVGISLFMGGNTTPSRATVQTAGSGYRRKERLIIRAGRIVAIPVGFPHATSVIGAPGIGVAEEHRNARVRHYVDIPVDDLTGLYTLLTSTNSSVSLSISWRSAS